MPERIFASGIVGVNTKLNGILVVDAVFTRIAEQRLSFHLIKLKCQMKLWRMVKAAKQVDLDQKTTRIRAQGATRDSTVTALRYQSIKNASERFALGRADVKHLFGISESTQFRYEKQNPVLKPAIADRLERFNRICQQALELFEDETETQRWLSTPKVALEGQTPLSALSTDAGAKKVEEMLYRAEYGMFG